MIKYYISIIHEFLSKLNKKKSELLFNVELEYPYSSEVFFCSDRIQAVYSCYSSSIIYAKKFLVFQLYC